MRAALLFICLFLTAQDDPYKILQDPARRAKEFDRQTALKAFREQSQSNPAAWVAARFLSKTDKEWKLAGGDLDAYLKTYWTGAPLSAGAPLPTSPPLPAWRSSPVPLLSQQPLARR